MAATAAAAAPTCSSAEEATAVLEKLVAEVTAPANLESIAQAWEDGAETAAERFREVINAGASTAGFTSFDEFDEALAPYKEDTSVDALLSQLAAAGEKPETVEPAVPETAASPETESKQPHKRPEVTLELARGLSADILQALSAPETTAKIDETLSQKPDADGFTRMVMLMPVIAEVTTGCMEKWGFQGVAATDPALSQALQSFEEDEVVNATSKKMQSIIEGRMPNGGDPNDSNSNDAEDSTQAAADTATEPQDTTKAASDGPENPADDAAGKVIEGLGNAFEALGNLFGALTNEGNTKEISADWMAQNVLIPIKKFGFMRLLSKNGAMVVDGKFAWFKNGTKALNGKRFRNGLDVAHGALLSANMFGPEGLPGAHPFMLSAGYIKISSWKLTKRGSKKEKYDTLSITGINVHPRKGVKGAETTVHIKQKEVKQFFILEDLAALLERTTSKSSEQKEKPSAEPQRHPTTSSIVATVVQDMDGTAGDIDAVPDGENPDESKAAPDEGDSRNQAAGVRRIRASTIPGLGDPSKYVQPTDDEVHEE